VASRSSSKSKSKNAGAQLRAYFASLSPDARKDLKRIRDAIRAAAPGVEQSFSYGIPAFRLEGRPLVWYAGWREHTSIYPIGPAIVHSLSPALDGYEKSKGTVRFPLKRPPSAALVKRIVKARVAEIAKRGR
jgi:uncharacterized protein YdhG (YjbR/CyaY superfamily)